MASKKLKITCRSNPDYNGEWTKQDVEEEITDIMGKVERDNDWIDWVLEHCFEAEDIDRSVIDVMLIPNTMSITYMSKTSGMVTIEKI